MKPPETLLEYLVACNDIVIFTGAGISTGAGIPDYRGPNGIYKPRPEVSFQDFFELPEKREMYWTFKAEDSRAWRDAGPTPVHRAIRKLEEMGKLRAVITQNIDGLHRRAGTSADKLIELHGRADQVDCIDCGFTDDCAVWYDAWLERGEKPFCPHCDQFLKPGVILFGQNLKEEDLTRAQRAMAGPDLVIALGSTLSVHPAATFPIMAARAGIPYLIVNQGDTMHDGMPHVSLRIEDDVQAVFPAAVEDAAAMFG
jgi:NAD-dependent deacetylase